MAVSQPIIRAATLADVNALAEIEREAWPAALAASVSDVRARIVAFPEGQLLAELAGTPVGIAWAQRITQADLNAGPATFDRLTDGGRFTASHGPQGEIYQLIGVAVAAAGRSQRLGRRLVDSQIALARTLADVRRIIGFTRPVGFANYPQLTIEQYTALCDDSGKPLDPMLTFHLGAGAQMVSIHPAFRPEDELARGYGVLIEYAR
jgi:predicted N-acetyltransferase YhbS